jgi:hypothetical protein
MDAEIARRRGQGSAGEDGKGVSTAQFLAEQYTAAKTGQPAKKKRRLWHRPQTSLAVSRRPKDSGKASWRGA